MGAMGVIRFLMMAAILLSMSSYDALKAQEDSAPKTVNIEIIVDSSGSMAAATPNGELRVDAAKRVLTQVVSEIPSVDGVNVGYRVYGHLGNNQADGMAESCLSSELVVPVAGLDVPALTTSINSLTPVGWTPLAFSLEEAANDFSEPSSENVVNAIVLVTDGLETCGGDPVAVAGALKNSEAGITSHVIGFGTTPEELAILGGIADASGGLLIGADDASSLTSALFDILQELEVVQGVDFIGGNGLSLLGPGTAGEISVLSHGQYDGNMLPVVIRNNTGIDIIRPTMTVVAKNSVGQQVAVGSDQMFHPNLVRSGGVSIGYAYFGGVPIPPDATFEFSFSPTPATESQYENIRDLEIVDSSSVNGSVVGTLRNGYDAQLDGPFSTTAICLDSSGQVINLLQGFTEVPSLAPEGEIPFQVTNFLGTPCDYYLAAASGWDNSFGPNNSVLPPGDAAPTAVPNVVASPSMACVDTNSVESVLDHLISSGMPIGDTEVYTAETDPNGLLGRPLQYVGKATFRDTRIVPMYADMDFADGGTIELFATAEDAQARYAYVMDVIRETPALSHYLYLNGNVLVRISGSLTPDQVTGYETAVAAIQPCAASAFPESPTGFATRASDTVQTVRVRSIT